MKKLLKYIKNIYVIVCAITLKVSYVLTDHKSMSYTSAKYIVRSSDLFYHSKYHHEALGGVIASREMLLDYKSSDLLFVLGSGTSINEIDERKWEHVSMHDSFAFNQFIAHQFVPTFYNVETPNPVHVNKWLSMRKSDYKSVPIFFNLKHLSDIKDVTPFLHNGKAAFTSPRVIGGSLNTVKDILEYYYSKERYLKSEFYIHYRGSLSLIISLGVLAGYKKIVLLGVDLKDYKYFFEKKDLYNTPVGESVRQYHNFNKNNLSRNYNGVHSTNDKNLFPGTATIEEYLLLYSKIIEEKLGVKIYIGNKSSAIYPMLPYYSM